MSFNPFQEKPKKTESTVMNWKQMAPKPYDKNTVDPYTKTRIILMSGTEFEGVWSGHQRFRSTQDMDVRREVTYIRRLEQQQQKMLAALKPLDETILETTIAYEQLAVDLTAFLAKRATNKNVKAALDFALLEDFDHLYRYADLLENDAGIHAERLVGKYTEIMPGRPTVAHHRCPYDSVKYPIENRKNDLMTICDTHIITAAEQQTMNFYMNHGNYYPNEEGRKLFTEIGMVEEQHVSQYGSLIDPNATFLESFLMHQYLECYLYYSMYCDETEDSVKKIWELCLQQEISHLHAAKNLLQKYERKDWQEVIPEEGEFPQLVQLHSNKEYIRKILGKTVWNTADRESYTDLKNLPEDAGFYAYQKAVCPNVERAASHLVIENYIKTHDGSDYRYQDSEHPVRELRDRDRDNTEVGRVVRS